MKPNGYRVFVHRKTNLPCPYLYVIKEIQEKQYLCNEVVVIKEFGYLKEVFMDMKFSRNCQLHYHVLTENFRTPTINELRLALREHFKMEKLWGM